MKVRNTMIAAGLVAAFAAGAGLMNNAFALQPDEGTPWNLVTAAKTVEGIPQNPIMAMKADEGVPQNLVTVMSADEGVPHNLVSASNGKASTNRQ